MRRLAIFWLACAVIGFLAAMGAACVLSLAVDGPASWRAEPRAGRPQRQGANGASNTAAARPAPIVASAVGGAAGS